MWSIVYESMFMLSILYESIFMLSILYESIFMLSILYESIFMSILYKSIFMNNDITLKVQVRLCFFFFVCLLKLLQISLFLSWHII